MKIHLLNILIIIGVIFIESCVCKEGCEFSAIRGELKCVLLTTSDITAYLPLDNRDLVRWMTLYVGTSSQLHLSSPVPITYPDLSQFPRLSFLRVYIYSSTPSPNYAPHMFRSTAGLISVITLYTIQPVPLDIGLIGREPSLDRLKILRASNFNITGVTNGNLAALSGVETLQLFNAETGTETILLDSVFKLGITLPNMKKLSLEGFSFYPLLTSPSLLSPLTALQSLTLKMSSASNSIDESVFFNARIFPALQVLELLGFEFSHFESVNTFFSAPPLTKLRMQALATHPLPLSLIAQPEGSSMFLEELNLENFNIGNITHGDMRHLASLERLYLAGSEDTVEVSSGAFASNRKLSRLRFTYMPALQLIAPDALLGLTELNYLHLGNLNSLRTLSLDTSSLSSLSSLYITNNRDLEEVPVEFFRPLVSLKMLSVRSSRFDEVCDCRHSFLSSLLTFSRPDPLFRLRSSCHDNGEFLKCTKNYQSTMCWDFEEECSHFCIPSGNLSYSCACPAEQGDLEGTSCVDLSRCGVSTDGIASHYCHWDKFSCVTHLRNQTISCSCYPDHALSPDSMSCVSMRGCSQTADGYTCQEEGLVCSDKSCQCVDGRNWDPATKTCLEATTTTPPTTTETTTTPPTTTPATTTTTTTTPATTTTETTTPATTTTETTTTPALATTKTTTTPATTTTTKTPATTTTKTTTTPALATTKTTKTPATTITKTSAVATTTENIPTTTQPIEITTATTTTESSTSPSVSTIPSTTSTTEASIELITDTTTPVPISTAGITGVNSDTTDLASVTSSAVSTEEQATTVPVTDPIEPTLLVERVQTTAETPGSTEERTTLFPLMSDITYILALTLGSLFVGAVILILIVLVVVLLVKILIYNRNSKYRLKPESMRSFESSNTPSTPPTILKELSV